MENDRVCKGEEIVTGYLSRPRYMRCKGYQWNCEIGGIRQDEESKVAEARGEKRDLNAAHANTACISSRCPSLIQTIISLKCP